MEYSELILKRHSVRSFKTDAVPSDILKKILEAGRVAPTAKNLQPVKIIVARSEEVREKLKSVSPCTFNAPIVLVFCGLKDEAFLRDDNRLFAETDSCIVATHVMLAAANEGLGTTWVARFLEKELSAALELPENIVPYALMPLGYPADDDTPSPKHTEKKAFEDFVEFR